MVCFGVHEGGMVWTTLRGMFGGPRDVLWTSEGRPLDQRRSYGRPSDLLWTSFGPLMDVLRTFEVGS